MKQALLLFLMTLGITTTYAQDLPDPEAKKVLQDLKSVYDGYSSIAVDFDLVLDLRDQDQEIQKGSLIQQGDYYKVDVADQAIYCNGDAIWVHLKDNNEVQINDMTDDEESDFLSPKDMLKIYDSDEFYYAITEDKKVKGNRLVTIEFKPLDPDSEFSKMKLHVDASFRVMKKMEVFQKDGNNFTLDIKKITPNKSYTKGLFTFDIEKYPGIYVEDLRL